MKKYILIFVVALMMSLSFMSCETTYTATQDDIYDYERYEVRTTVSFDVLIRYGTPYYYRGSILYYLYDGIYYYPYWYNDYWYVKAFLRPINPLRYNYHFRPSYRDYRFAPGVYRGYGVPPRRPHNGHMNRPPQVKPARMPRNSQNNVHFGGKR